MGLGCAVGSKQPRGDEPMAPDPLSQIHRECAEWLRQRDPWTAGHIICGAPALFDSAHGVPSGTRRGRRTRSEVIM